MTATGGRLFGVLATGSNVAVTIERIARNGSILRRRFADPLAYYVSQIAAQRQAVFIATNVIKRFTNAPDELLRLNARTLKTTGRISLPGGVVALVSDPGDVWVALADRILRLDPGSLAVKATYSIPGAVPPPLGSSSISSLARGRGGLWATFGDSRHTALYRLDPASLAVLGRVEVPEPGQGIQVVAGPGATWVWGPNFARRVEPSGHLGKPVRGDDLQAAAVQGRGLLALSYRGKAVETLIQIDQRGGVVARSDVGDAGGRLAVDGRNVWLLHGLALAHWTLTNPCSARDRRRQASS